MVSLYFFESEIYVMGKRTEIVTFRTSPEAKKAIQKLANDSYKTLSEYMNSIVERLLEDNRCQKENE